MADNSKKRDLSLVAELVPIPVYTVNRNTYELIYMNNYIASYYSEAKIGDKCYKALWGRNTPCDNCVINSMKDGINTITKSMVNAPVMPGNCYNATAVSTKSNGIDSNNITVFYNMNKSMFNPLVNNESSRNDLERKYAFIYSHSSDEIIEVNLATGKYKIHSSQNVFGNNINQFDNYNEYVSYYMENIIHKDDKVKFNNLFELDALRTIQNENINSFVEEFKILTPTNEVRWREFRFFFINDENETVAFISARDTTDIRSCEEQRFLERKRLYKAIETVYILTVSVNLTRDIYNFGSNPSEYFSVLRGAGRYSDLSYYSSLHIHPDDVEANEAFSLYNLKKFVEQGSGEISREIRYLKKDNTYSWISVIATVIKPDELSGNTDCYAILLLENIDKRKSSEQDLRDALMSAQAANESKSQFFARMSHDIRTPMNAIIGMSSIAKNHIDDKKLVNECLTKVMSASEFLLKLINDILDTSKIESGKMIIENEIFSVDDFIGELKDLFSELTKSKQQSVVMDKRIILQNYLVGDTLRLKQVFMNLLSNAIKFTPEHGRITTSVVQKMLDNGTVNNRVTISDDGIGIDSDTMERIFKPFEQGANKAKSYGGSGLGLAICQNLVQLMGGAITVESKLNQGTKFIVDIPLKYSDGTSAPEKQDNYPLLDADLHGLNILLADDDNINQEIFTLILTEKGANLTVACDGRDVVDKFMNSPMGYFDIVLMDVQMPIMSGLDATLAIRGSKREDNDVPIVAMTANVFNDDIAAVYAHGMNGYIEKPVKNSLLFMTISKLIMSKKLSDEGKKND